MSHNFSPYGHPKGHMDPATGKWVRNADVPVDEGTDQPTMSVAPKLAISYATPDGTVLYTVPTGKQLYIEEMLWEITTGFTGGSSSAIGASSNASGFTAKGSLLGGASGDVAATLVAGTKKGTAGSALPADGAVLPAGANVRFDAITSAFTAGAGFIHVIGRLVDE